MAAQAARRAMQSATKAERSDAEACSRESRAEAGPPGRRCRHHPTEQRCPRTRARVLASRENFQKIRRERPRRRRHRGPGTAIPKARHGASNRKELGEPRPEEVASAMVPRSPQEAASSCDSTSRVPRTQSGRTSDVPPPQTPARRPAEAGIDGDGARRSGGGRCGDGGGRAGGGGESQGLCDRMT